MGWGGRLERREKKTIESRRREEEGKDKGEKGPGQTAVKEREEAREERLSARERERKLPEEESRRRQSQRRSARRSVMR